MTSKRQLEANRANSRRSTGPRSSIGKFRSARNAVKHGLTAKYENVIGDEDPAEFQRLREDLIDSFQPSSRFELELLDRAAGLLWRLRRVPGLEAALVKAEQESAYYARVQQEARRRFDESYENDESAISLAMLGGTYAAVIGEIQEEVDAEWRSENASSAAQDSAQVEPEDGMTALSMLIRDLQGADWLGKLNRYETSLMNALTRTVQQLHVLQTLRGTTKLISAE